MSVVLDISDAAKRFEDIQALDGVTLSLHKGEYLALLGPNGAGKTTLVRAVSGRVRLDAGTVTVSGGREDTAPFAPHAELGIVTQQIALYPRLTAEENLAAWGRLAGLSAPELGQRIVWALEWTGLADRRDDLVKHYSTGMMRRLNIACSVLHEPSILLLDEPTVGVDPQSRLRIWEMLEDMRRQGVSCLLTTHQLDEAQRLCERIVIIDDGRVIADGTFDELVAKTVGPERRITFRLDAPAPGALKAGVFEIVDEVTLRSRIDHLAEEIPGLLAQISGAGVKVNELFIETPTLHDVFIHLTGKALRQ